MKLLPLIVHEASHKFAGTHDYGYAMNADYAAKLRSHQNAIANADSYAWATLSVGMGKLIKSPQDLMGM